MNETELCDLLHGLLDGDFDAEDFAEATGGAVQVLTFEEAGLLAGNKGLVVRCGVDGDEFQLTVVRSR